MFDVLGWFRRNPEREIKHLNRDARAVVDSVFLGYPAARAREVAVRTRAYIDDAHEKAGNDAGRYGEVAAQSRTLNQEARQRGDQVAMRSHTLANINLGAEAHGPACAPARAAIDEFLGHWSHVGEGSGEG